MRTETFQTPGPVRLDVSLGGGEISIEAADVQETTVELEPLRDNDASFEAVQNARIELRERPSVQEVVVDVRGRKRLLFHGIEVLVQIRCPDGSSLESRSGSADVRGRGRFRSVDVETGSGDVEFDEIDGGARINAASGDVQLGTVGGEGHINTASGEVEIGLIGGEAELNSASGDIDIREAGGPLRVNSASGDVTVKQARSSVHLNTASGDQSLGSVSTGKVELKSASGDLKVGITEGSKLFVDARSRSGDVSSELEVSDVPPEGDSPLVELRANTMSGDIQIVRA